MKKINSRFVSIIILVWAIDVLSKFIVVEALSNNEVISFWGGLVHFRLVYNSGGVGGIFQGYPFVFQMLTGLGIVFLLVFYIKFEEHSNLFRLSLSLIIGGALGNFTDRFYRHGVVDFIDLDLPGFIPIDRWYTFNLADSFILTGAILLTISFILIEIRVKTQKKQINKDEAIHQIEN